MTFSDGDDDGKRTETIYRILRSFCKTRSEVHCDWNIARRLSQTYRGFRFGYMVKRMGNNRIDQHKIISLTAYTILACFPLRIQGFAGFTRDEARKNESLRRLHGEFALFASLYILKQHLDKNTGGSIDPLFKRPALLKEHRLWLQEQPEVGVERFPIFLNAQLWYTIEEICLLDN